MTNEEAKHNLFALKLRTKSLSDKEALGMAIKALKQQPSEDCVSRSELQKTMDSLTLFRFVNNDHEEADDYYNCESVDMVIRNLPSVTPQYTDEEIDRAQAVEQAYVDKMVELAVEETKRPKGKWKKIQSGDKDFPESIVCSRCKNENSHLDFDEHSVPIGKVFVTSKYCPNCGAMMDRGGENEETKEAD